MMENNRWKQLQQTKWFWPVCVGAAVCVLSVFAYFYFSGVSITPTLSNSEGISPASAFTITAPGQKEQSLRQKIITEPPVAYSLQKEAGSFVLRPLAPFVPNSSFTIKIGSKKFTYQVRNALVVSSHFPTDKGQKVTSRSGIEFTFNTNDLTLEDFEKALSIQPIIQGRVEQGDGRYVFYPQKGMDYETTYTVRLSPPFATPDGAKLEEKVVFSFTTCSKEEEEEAYFFQLNDGLSYNSLTTEAPVVPMYLDAVFDKQPVSVKIYRCGDAAAYREELIKYNSNRRSGLGFIDTSAMTQVSTFESVPFRLVQDDAVQSGGKGSYNSSALVVQFPESLEEGYYAAEFTVQSSPQAEGGQRTITRHMLLQVSDLSVFHMRWDKNLLLWVNNAKTGEPVEGAELIIETGYPAAAVTGKDGVAYVDDAQLTAGNTRYGQCLFTVAAGDKTFVDSSSFYDYDDEQERAAHKYNYYLFTDRPIYRTSDTMKVWGMIRPRESSTSKPKKITLDLNGEKTQVTPASNGLFTAEITFSGMQGGDWPRLQLMLEDLVVGDQYVRVEDYVKPVYTAQSSTDRPVYLLPRGDKPVVTLEVSTFDGTPAPDFSVMTESWSDMAFDKSGQQLRTDKEGRLTIPMTIRNYETTDSWYPYSYDYRFSNNEAEAENFYQYGSVYAIHRDIMLQGQVEEKSGGTRVLVTTNKIDTSRIKSQEDLWQTELLKGEAVTKNVEASLYKIYYTKEEAGVSYDYINREMVTAYNYVRHEDLEQQYTITTQQGSYVLDGLPKSTDHEWYRLELSTTDSTGRMVRYQVYLSNPWEYGYRSNDGTHRYVLDKRVSPEEAQAATQINVGDGYYYKPYSELSASFGDDEDVTFVLMDNDEPMENFKGRLLYTVVQDDFHHTAVTEKGEVAMPFGEDLVPNYIITGAYFDGKHIYALEDKYMRFSPQKRELEVSVTTDQDRYQPADEAKVTVTVTDKTTGKPQPGAQVVLSVVDEAIFALQEQNIDVLNSIYRSIYWPYPQKYTSFRQPGFNNAGEKGGGGGGDGQMRVDFKDTAWFQNGVTGKDGTFSAVFQLPDNITSWRFTALSITDDGKAGSTKEKAAATKDYFVTPIVSEQLLAGDTLAVGLRSSGVGVSANDQADYTVTVKNLETGEEQSITASGRLRTLKTAAFDSLSAGNYTVTVQGRCKGFADGVQLPVTVVESGIEVSRVGTFNLKDGISVTPLRYPVTVALYDQSMVTYNKVFANLLQKSSGIRTDARLVRVFIAKEYQNQGIDSYLSEVTQQDAKLLREGSLFGVLPYAQPDAELTIKMILAAPELVSKNGLYELGLQGTGAGESVAVRYLAEALSGEDNKAEIKAILDEGLASFTDEAYLAAALAVSEEPAAATAWYDRAVRPNLVELQGVSGEKVLAVKAQQDISQDDCTAAASMVATLLQHNDASQLVSYLAQKDSIYEPYYLEQLLYLTRWQPAKAQGAKVSWQRDGKTVTKELGRSTEYLSLSRQQLAEANFKVQAGTVYADVYYAAPAQEVKDDENKLIGMTKTITPVNGDSFQVGDLVKITITADLGLFDGDIGEGELVIEDYLPSGMRFERYGATYQAAQYNPDSFWYLSNREQQRIRFGAWVTGKNLKLQPVVYYARCTTPGSYVVESTYMSSQTGPVWGSTQRDTIVIEP